MTQKSLSEGGREFWRHCGLYLGGLASAGASPVSRVFSRRKSPAASRMRLNSMQKAWTSMNRSCTLIILFRIRDCRKTQTSRTRRFWRRETSERSEGCGQQQPRSRES